MKRVLITMMLASALSAAAFASDDCCGKDAKMAKAGAKKSCCGQTLSAEDQFIAEAKKMEAQADAHAKAKGDCCGDMKAEAKKEDCCAEGDKSALKFKVFVAGKGYKFFDCEMSASKTRKELLAKSMRVGQVQKVIGKIATS